LSAAREMAATIAKQRQSAARRETENLIVKLQKGGNYKTVRIDCKGLFFGRNFLILAGIIDTTTMDF